MVPQILISKFLFLCCFYSVTLLKQRDKNSSQEWLNKLPQMVKQLEVSLYRSAESFEAYADKSTLKQRLQVLGMEIAKKTHPNGGDEHNNSVIGGEKHRDNGSSTGGVGGGNLSIRRQQLDYQQQPPPPFTCTAKEGECRKTPHCAEMKRLWTHISKCHDNHCRYPHCISSRYVLMHYKRCKDPSCPSCGPVRKIWEKPSEETEENPAKRMKQENGASNQSLTPNPEENGIKAETTKVQTEKPEEAYEDHSYSIMNNFTIDQIELHLQSLKQSYSLPQKVMKEKCLALLKVCQDHVHFWVFSKPVDPIELGLPDYFDVIKKPMDLGTVQKKLEGGQYHSIEDFNSDVRLTFDNALAYTESGSAVNDIALQMKEEYEKSYDQLLDTLQKEEEDRLTNERACSLCGFEKLQFEPPVFFCNNLKCPSKRIRRNTHFYSGGNNQYNYCNACFNDLESEIALPDMTLKKADLKKKKNDEVHEENWVHCDECKRWIHQICGLFNSRQNKDSNSSYCCPKCLLEKRKKGKSPGKLNMRTAEQLPRTKLSEWIEDSLGEKIKKQYKVLAREKSEVEVSLIL